MTTQNIDGITFRIKEKYDFGFIADYGRVFRVFDDQDSGNICFGAENAEGRTFIKFAGAPAARYDGDTAQAVKRLKEAEKIYTQLRHPSLISFRESVDIGGGYALVFDWADGECMGRMYEESHRRIMGLPTEEKLGIFSAVTDFLKYTAASGYTAVDFYDGSVMYDEKNKKTTICDLDFFRKQPACNDMGRMWGSSRFMSPEEYEKGAVLDEITNVFTLGQMGFSLFTDSDYDPTIFPLGTRCYDILMKAISPERENRFRTIAEFEIHWLKEIKGDKYV